MTAPASLVTTVDLTVGVMARRFTRDEFSKVTRVRPVSSKGVEVSFEDGSRVTVGRGASFQVLDA